MYLLLYLFLIFITLFPNKNIFLYFEDTFEPRRVSEETDPISVCVKLLITGLCVFFFCICMKESSGFNPFYSCCLCEVLFFEGKECFCRHEQTELDREQKYMNLTLYE